MKIKVLNTDGIPDNVGDVFTAESQIDIPDQVPVRNYFTFKEGDNNVLGYAKLIREPDGIYAEIDFPVKGIPAIGGFSHSREDSLVKHCSINQIAVQDQPNADPRIGEIDVK